MAEKRITEAQFSMQCSFIAKNAAAWAGDLLTLPEHYNREAYTHTVARFTDELRGRLDRLDAWAGRGDAPSANSAACPGWQPIATAPTDGTQIIGRTTQEQVFACNWFWDDENETEGNWLEHGTDVVRPREWLSYPATPAKGAADA